MQTETQPAGIDNTASSSSHKRVQTTVVAGSPPKAHVGALNLELHGRRYRILTGGEGGSKEWAYKPSSESTVGSIVPRSTNLPGRLVVSAPLDS